jgi:hypothetical protein
MQQQNQNVVLTLDNFSRHYVEYQLKNVLLIVFFKPNLTAWIQPLNASIIHCVKVHYHQGQCRQVLDCNNAEEADIWAMDQLKAVCLMDCTWDNITMDTIMNCWRHTKILTERKEQALTRTDKVDQA